MIVNPFLFPWMMMPWIPNNCEKPPTVYAILNSIVNYDQEDKQKIKDLALFGRSKIFDFSYPLSNNINKVDFECLILNHYLMRRIGFDTPTAFKISLNAKLNEIMPKYNKLFDCLQNWDIFNDGEKFVRDEIENGTNNQTSTNNQTMTSTNQATSTSSDVSDRRNSDLPQSELENLRDGSYVSDYNYDTNNSNVSDTSSQSGTNEQSGTNNTITDNTRHIVETRSPSDKIAIYKQMQDDINSIYTMIFKDLDVLFYGLE